MDTFTTDPFRGRTSAVMPFNASRWRRAGATEHQVSVLRERWENYSQAERDTEEQWMRSVPDSELAAYLQQGQMPEPDETPSSEDDEGADADVNADDGADAGGEPTA